MKLSEEAEEVATFYGRMLDHDYTTMDAFNKNFFADWRSVRTPIALKCSCTQNKYTCTKTSTHALKHVLW